VGKIYQIKDGIFTTDAGLRLNHFGHTTTFEDAVEAFNDWLPGTTKFELVPDLPRICEVLGVEVGEHFKITTGFIYWVSEGGYIQGDKTAVNTPTLCSLINHPEKIIRTPQFSEDEKALMRLYVGEKLPWFARDKNGCIEAYEVEPGKEPTRFTANDWEDEHSKLLSKFLLQITWENSPFNAAEYLEGLE